MQVIYASPRIENMIHRLTFFEDSNRLHEKFVFEEKLDIYCKETFQAFVKDDRASVL